MRNPNLLSVLTLVSLATALTITGCSEPSTKDAKPVVACVNYPLAYFADRIGGDAITVHFPEIDGDPAFWEPSDADITTFQTSDLILRNGATYAKWAKTVTLPEDIQVDTSKAFQGALIEVKETGLHAHGDGEAHAHAGTAFTTWLDFQNAALQADAVAAALSKLVPEQKDAFAERAKLLADDLAAIEKETIEICKGLKDLPLVASHPVYQYLAKAYGLNLKAVHWEPDVAPGAEGIAELKKALNGHAAKTMIWEDAPIESSVAELKAMGIGSLVFNPAGNRPESGDFLSVMKSNLQNLKSLN